MAKKDLYSSLQKIASESVGGNPTAKTEDAKELILKEETAKLTQVKQLAERMYPNSKDNQFAYWKKNTDISSLSNETKKEYWKFYQELNPRGFESTKDDFINVTKRELSQIYGVTSKEFFLRDRISNSPDWVKPILEEELAKVSTIVANANYNKSAQVYAKDVQNRATMFLSNVSLDPDISIDDHTNDLVKLEQLNLMDVATVLNGRAGVFNEAGAFVPSFAINNRSDIFKADAYGAPSVAEQMKVKDVSLPYFKKAIEESIYMNRATIKTQERTSELEATKLLEQGNFNIDRWGEAFSMLPEADPQEQIIRGIKGEISAKRVNTYKELAQTVYAAMNQYGNMLGENQNG